MTQPTESGGSKSLTAFRGSLLEDEPSFWEGQTGDQYALVDLVNRLLDRGVVITGDITISVAGVDLAYLGLSAVLTSVSTARRTMGRDVGLNEE